MSCSSYLALLEEKDNILKGSALNRLLTVVDTDYPVIFDAMATIEALFEDKTFPDHRLAALVAAKVYYHLGEFDDALTFCLGAETLFAADENSRFAETIVSKALKEYIAGQKEGKVLNPKLVFLAQAQLDLCGNAQQALGIALEARRLDAIETILDAAGGREGVLLRYVVSAVSANESDLSARTAVLALAAKRYRALQIPDHVAAAHCLLHLSEAGAVAELLLDALRKSGQGLAFQLAFDIEDNASQGLLASIRAALQAKKVDSDPEDTLATIDTVLSGSTTVELSLSFLYRQCNSDLNILRRAKAAIEQRSSICHNGLVLANALMHAGTTRDTFLRRNLDWLSRATNWAKFSATASLGVIHRGSLSQAFTLLSPYIAPDREGASAPSGPNASPYAEGGGLFALGIIHANHGAGVRAYFLRALRNDLAGETIKHGACLGAGTALMGTHDVQVYEALRDVLFTESAVAGEAAALAMGLVMCGSASCAEDMLGYANETHHEKIERGLAIGIALVMQGRERQADAIIKTLQAHKSPLMRYGAALTVAMAYAGTGDNAAIARLLNVAVSDPSDDVRRAAVMALGFVMCRQGEQCAKLVALLAESYNPHVRHGSAMALGVSCAASGSPAALRLLKPLLTDTADFVRQGAFIAHAMVLQQFSTAQNDQVDSLRKQLASTLGDKHQSQMTKLGALLATGIIDAGGRNAAITLVSRSGLIRPPAVVGVMLFMHHWYWYPSVHFLSLAFAPTGIIAVNERFKMPHFAFRSNAKPSVFAYPPMLKQEKKEKKEKVSTAVLSYAKKVGRKDDMDVDDAKAKADAEEAEKAAAAAAAAKEAADEPTSLVLQNPARVTRQQLAHISFDVDERYTPVILNSDVSSVCAVVVLKDLKPSEPESLVIPEKTTEEPASAAAQAPVDAPADAQPMEQDDDGEAPPPADFVIE